MRQFQLMYDKPFGFETWLNQIQNFAQGENLLPQQILFRVYSDTTDSSLLPPVMEGIKALFPDALYCGCSTKGNIVRGSLVDKHISITCTLFEEKDSRAEILQFPMNLTEQDKTAGLLLEAIKERPWVKGVEMLTTMNNADMLRFSHLISDLPEGIQFYGGGAHGGNLNRGDMSDTYVFSSAGELTNQSAVFILMGGSSLHIQCLHLSGWQKLGYPFKVTGFKDRFLLELDHKSAASVYQHYLNIPIDQHFFRLANVFPFSFEEDGVSFVRVVTAVEEDGSLRLGGGLRDPSTCQLTYGDPAGIMESLNKGLDTVSSLTPQVILLLTCAARQFFWGANEVSRETLPFESLASTSGFYTSGEFLRTKKEVLLHNATIVVVCMREGEAGEPKQPFYMDPGELSHQLLVSRCLASFIDAMTQEKAEEL